MGEEVKMSEYEPNNNGNGADEERVGDWEIGLPNVDDLTPLSQPLIPPELASAFSISLEPHRTFLEVNRESQNTILNLRSFNGALSSNNFKSYDDRTDDPPEEATAADESEKLRRIDSEEADSVLRTENFNGNGNNNGGEDPSGKALKSPRLVWTPQLHKRFVDVVGYLGIKNAVPKTIMQLMNVEGLTRENVASHLQKYRLYLKRMQGLSNEGPSASDQQLFASMPVPQSLHDNGNGNSGNGNGNGNENGNGHTVHVPVPYHPGIGHHIMPMSMYGMQMGNGNRNGNNAHGHNPYGLMRDWNGNNYYHHM